MNKTELVFPCMIGYFYKIQDNKEFLLYGLEDSVQSYNNLKEMESKDSFIEWIKCPEIDYILSKYKNEQ